MKVTWTQLSGMNGLIDFFQLVCFNPAVFSTTSRSRNITVKTALPWILTDTSTKIEINRLRSCWENWNRDGQFRQFIVGIRSIVRFSLSLCGELEQRGPTLGPVELDPSKCPTGAFLNARSCHWWWHPSLAPPPGSLVVWEQPVPACGYNRRTPECRKTHGVYNRVLYDSSNLPQQPLRLIYSQTQRIYHLGDRQEIDSSYTAIQAAEFWGYCFAKI